jgi:hypothetical protein
MHIIMGIQERLEMGGTLLGHNALRFFSWGVFEHEENPLI